MDGGRTAFFLKERMAGAESAGRGGRKEKVRVHFFATPTCENQLSAHGVKKSEQTAGKQVVETNYKINFDYLLIYINRI